MNHEDKRSSRTRQALTSAFVQILLADGYAAVTVQRVAARAGVGRSTFYLHFSGKQALLRRSLTAPSTQLLRLVRDAVEPRHLVPQLKHFREQRVRNRIFLLEPIRSLWADFLAEMIEAQLRPRSRTGATAVVPALPRRLVALQLAESQLALIARWLRNADQASELSIAAALVATTRAQLDVLAPTSDCASVLPERHLSCPPSARGGVS